MTPKESEATAFALIVSPYEDKTNAWNIYTFSDEQGARDYVSIYDLTKEHWFVSVYELVEMLREKYPDE